MMPFAVNGRFLTQPLSGVQRYAREVLSALDALLPAEGPPVPVWYPDGHGDIVVPGWQRLRPVMLGGGAGHLWEQVTLARVAGGMRLLSLCGSGPVMRRNQIVVIHDANIWDVPESFPPGYRLFHGMMRPMLARRVARIATVSHAAAAALAPRLGIGAERIAVVPNGAGHLAATAPDAGALRRYGLSPGGYLLAVGNQSPNKNLARLAAAHLRANALGVGSVPPLVVAGGVASGVRAAVLAPREGLHLLGRVSDGELRALYDGAMAFLWPPLLEGFGIPPLEAMALGVPVAASRTSAMPEVLGDAPLWFDPRDENDMAEAILRIASLSGPARTAMVERGRERARIWTWERAALRLRDLLAEQG